MRWIGVVTLVAMICLPAPAEAWREHGRWHQWRDGAPERYVTPYALERGHAYSAAPGRGLANTLIDESMHEPVVRYAPPQRTQRQRVVKPHRRHDIHRAAPKRRNEEARHDAEPQREVVRREPESPRKEETPAKPPLTEAEKPKPAPQVEAKAPPPETAAKKAPASEAEEPPRLHGEAAEMQRQREEWLKGITQERGFERW
jgi:hypothetical protein